MPDWVLDTPVNSVIQSNFKDFIGTIVYYKDINNEIDFSKTRFNALVTFWGKKVNRLIITIEYQEILVI